MKRPSKHRTMIDLTKVLKQQSTCPRLAVGAVMVDSDGFIVGTGWNGRPSGMPHCTDDGCLIIEGHDEGVVHAETNAILQAGLRAIDGTLYCEYRPCLRCALLIINSKVAAVYYETRYENDRDPQNILPTIFAQAGIKLVQLTTGEDNG